MLGSFAYTNPEFARAVELLGVGSTPAGDLERAFSLDQSAAAFESCWPANPPGSSSRSSPLETDASMMPWL